MAQKLEIFRSLGFIFCLVWSKWGSGAIMGKINRE